MDKLAYLFRRFLLLIPTFFGITILCFVLTRFVPGGPVEMRMLKMRGAAGSGELVSGGGVRSLVNEKQRQLLMEQFGFDKPLYEQYWDWMFVNKMGLNLESYDYPNKTAWQLISSRIPVSLSFGLTSFLLTYLICIPLGIGKALRHRQAFDSVSSILVFVAYALPCFAVAMVLKMVFCGTVEGGLDIFPLGGISSDFDGEVGFLTVVKDRIHHFFLPVCCYVAGSFAMLTVLMKNSLLDQISSDYIRTVIAKGATRRRAIWAHAFRNALIPIATGLGPMIGLLFAGSIIIETVFEIPGMGLLSWDALIGRDYAVFLALLALTASFQLMGNLISDILYLLIDPRIDFAKK